MMWILIAVAFFQADPADAWGSCLAERIDRNANGAMSADAVADAAMRHCRSHQIEIQRGIEREAGGASPEVTREIETMVGEVRQEMRALAAQVAADRPASTPRAAPAPANRAASQSRAPRSTAIACPRKLGAAQALVCQCTAQAAATGPVWGSNLYTDDSHICRAALHAGVIGARGGMVSVREAPGQSGYASSARNGVQSGPWGAWGRSIAFRAAAAQTATRPAAAAIGRACPANATRIEGQLECGCTAQSVAASGPVWGSGPYTADSRICRAARHAGAVGAKGGNVRVRIVPGLRAYSGSTRNGINSSGWGSYGKAYSFEQ